MLFIGLGLQPRAGSSTDGIIPDTAQASVTQTELRGAVLWGNLLAGGAGIEAYFGYHHAHNDINAEDFRSRENWRVGTWASQRCSHMGAIA